MRIEYIAKEGNHFKANLHCHTVFSDGKKTPAEIKEIYRAAGYSIVAYSDHNILLDHSELNDEHFLAMLATEYDVQKKGPEDGHCRPCFHINFFPRKTGQVSVPCFSPNRTRKDLLDRQPYSGSGDYVRSYEDIQDMIDRFANDGFLVQINHPVWSVQTIGEYLPLKNYFALEIYNHGCFVEGYDEFSTLYWDELLRAGQRVWGTATDDNHNEYPVGHPRCDALGGFTVIQAAGLTQEAVTDALEAGKFYASTGPLFHSVVQEDNILRVETSPVRKIMLTTGMRRARAAYPATGEKTLTAAEFDLSRFLPNDYIRLTLIDEQGNRAWSQPFYNYFCGKEA